MDNQYVFITNQSDLIQHNGKLCKIIKPLIDNVDIEVGNMYIIILQDGEELQAFEDELAIKD